MQNFEFTEYNPFTLTGRPSNHFGGINYAALRPTERHRFKSRHSGGYLVEFDLSGFHLYLLYLIIGMEFPKNVYEYLKQFYPEDVNAKDYTFRQIYGGIDKNLIGISPFKEIYNFQQTTYSRYLAGTLTTFLFNRPIRIPSLNSNKVFNYMLQNLETEFNSEIIDSIIRITNKLHTKLVLYTYDSFLIDYSPADGIDTLRQISKAFEGVPFHVKVGTNYGEMTAVNI